MHDLGLHDLEQYVNRNKNKLKIQTKGKIYRTLHTLKHKVTQGFRGQIIMDSDVSCQ